MLKIAQTAGAGKAVGDQKSAHSHDHERGKKKEKDTSRHGEAIMFVVRGLAFLGMGEWRSVY